MDDLLMDADVQQAIERAVAPLVEEVRVLRDELNLYKQSGLDSLRTRALAYHNLPYETAVPTAADEQGSPRIVETGGVRYFYARTSAGWERVALS